MESKKIVIFPGVFEYLTLNFSNSLNYDKFSKELAKFKSEAVSFKETRQILRTLFEIVEDSHIIIIFAMIGLTFGFHKDSALYKVVILYNKSLISFMETKPIFIILQVLI